MYAKVIVDVTSSKVDMEFDYHVPDHLVESIKVGARVVVSFGSREVFGFVLELKDFTEYQGTIKDIASLLDHEPFITQEQLSLSRHLKLSTTSLMISCLNLMIPDSLKGKTDKYIVVNDFGPLDADLGMVFQGKKKIPFSKDLEKLYKKIKKAEKLGLIDIVYQAKQVGGLRFIKKYRLKPEYTRDDFLEVRSVKQRSALLRLQQIDDFLTVEELCDRLECSAYLIQTVIQANYLDVVKIDQIKRHEPYRQSTRKHTVKTDNPVFEHLKKAAGKPLLCHFSNERTIVQTELDLIGTHLKNQKKVLFLVPNLIQIAQYELLFKTRFDCETATFDGSIPFGEYYENYRRFLRGEVQIALGTKKAAFLPLEAVDLVIVDSCESALYVNDQSPRYHMIDVLLHRGKTIPFQLCLFSVSPSLMQYEQGLKGTFHLFEDLSKPACIIKVIDMKKELSEGNKGVLSRVLHDELDIRQKNKQQSLLILNNKGYSQFVLCRECGHVAKCPNCKVSLKYDLKKNTLYCGYCTYSISFEKECPSCKSKHIRQMGFGLDKLEEVLQNEFPNAKILRVDADSHPTSKSYAKTMMQIEEGDADIIIGTEVLIRMSSFDNITLIGMLSADLLLSMPDYQAREKTFQMLTQSISKLNDKKDAFAIIQVYEPYHYAISTAVQNDFLEFVRKEFIAREQGGYPPYQQVNRILIKGSWKETFKVGNTLKKAMLNLIATQKTILGPIYNDKARAVQLIIKYKPDFDLSTIYQIIYDQYKDSTCDIIVERYPNNLV